MCVVIGTADIVCVFSGDIVSDKKNTMLFKVIVNNQLCIAFHSSSTELCGKTTKEKADFLSVDNELLYRNTQKYKTEKCVRTGTIENKRRNLLSLLVTDATLPLGYTHTLNLVSSAI